jgi:predicted nucleotidyltransferase
MGDKPCCAAAAAREVKQILVDGRRMGISHLDEVMEEVMGMNLETDAEIQEALLKKLAVFNYIPFSRRQVYSRALLDEYKRGC